MTARKAVARKAAPAKARNRPPNKRAVAREPEVDGFAIVEQCGVKLRIPLGDNIPLELIEVLGAETGSPQNSAATPKELAFEELRSDIAITQALIGPEQWEAFKAVRPTLRDYRELAAKLQELTGK